jgi:hypothetical protein
MKNIILLFILMPLYALSHSASNANLKKLLIELNQNWEHVNLVALDKDYNFSNEVDLIKLHLSLVEDELRRNTPSNLSAIQKQNRIKCLDILNKYWNIGVFPKNTFHHERTPYFIDIYGTYCAVGYLIKETGFDQVAQKIHQENNYGYINDLKKEYKEIDTWANEYGFTIDELAWIQPSYGSSNYNNCFSQTYSTQITIVNASCIGSCDGNIIVPTHNYWNLQPIVSAVISPSAFCGALCEGTYYTIFATDATSNSVSYSAYIGTNNPPANFSQENIDCNGECDGSISIDSIMGNINPTQFSLSQNNINLISQTTPLFDSLCAGYYTLTIGSSNGCNWNYGTFNITQPQVLNSTVTTISPILCNSDTAILQVNANGGIPPYSGIGIYNLPAGSYNFIVTDSNNCSNNNSFTLNEPTPLVVHDSVLTPILCYGDSALIELSALGGIPPYSGTGLFNKAAGIHTFSIQDSLGCIYTDSLYIYSPPLLSCITTITNPILCYGDSADIQVSGIGGTLPYIGVGSFNIAAGTQLISITDSNGCVQDTLLNVNQPQLLSCIATITNPILCYGDSAGIQVSGIGGTLPYIGVGSFNIAASTQLISITDSNGCVQDTLLNVNQPQLLSCIATITNPILCNGDSATIQVNANGGTMPYNGIGSFSSSTGTYTFVIADSNNCITDTSLTISSPSSILSSALGYSDNGTGNGSAKCIASGGTPPYTFFWSNSSISDSIANLSSGMYYVTITDANLCQMHDSVFVPLVFPAGIENSSSLNFAVYPNPSHGAFSIQFDHIVQAAALEIVNLLGEKIYEKKISSQQKETIQFDAPLGMYILKIKIAGREYTQKITKI